MKRCTCTVHVNMYIIYWTITMYQSITCPHYNRAETNVYFWYSNIQMFYYNRTNDTL